MRKRRKNWKQHGLRKNRNELDGKDRNLADMATRFQSLQSVHDRCQPHLEESDERHRIVLEEFKRTLDESKRLNVAQEEGYKAQLTELDEKLAAKEADLVDTKSMFR